MIGNVTRALQVAATNGNGFSVFFRDPNFVTFRVTGNGTVTAGAVTIEYRPDNMAVAAEARRYFVNGTNEFPRRDINC